MTGIYDLQLVGLSLIVVIIASFTALELAGRVSQKQGMLTLKQDGIEKVFQGHTDLRQIQAVCL